MANPLRGEASFKSGGQDYTLVVNINVLCALEEATGFGVDDMIAELNINPRLGLLRTVFCELLQPNHPGTTVIQAGEIMAEDLDAATLALGNAIKQAMPDQKKAGQANPPKRSRGTTG